MCNSTQRTSFLAARANSKLNESLLTVRSRIAKKSAQQAATPQPEVTAAAVTTAVTAPQTQQVQQPVQQQQQLSQVPGYNLVEKKKRKVRCGKEVGPQDQFMFHLKLEHETKKKRKNNRRKAPKQEEVQPIVTTSPKSQLQQASVQQQQPAQQVRATPQQFVTESKPMTNVIVSIIEAIAQDNNVIPTIVTMVDGCVLKCNSALNKLLAGTQNQVPKRSVIQNMLHPEDMTIHHIQLLKLLASNTDTSRYDLRMVNTDGRAIKVTLEVVCVRNDSALPQWLIVRVLAAQELDEYIRKEMMNQQQSTCKHEEFDLVNQTCVPTPVFTFYDVFVGSLERMFFKGQPAMFFDNNGAIAWNNPAFDALLGTSGRPFVGRQVLEIAELKSTPIELMTRSILADQHEKLEAQISPTNLPALGTRQLKCYAQKIPNINGGIYGYLWLFAINDCQASQDEQMIYDQLNDCMTAQKQLQEQLGQFNQQPQAAAPFNMDDIPVDESPVSFFLLNDVTSDMDERALDNMFAAADDKKFNYLDSHIVSFPTGQSEPAAWSNYDFFIDDASSDAEIESIFATL